MVRIKRDALDLSPRRCAMSRHAMALVMAGLFGLAASAAGAPASAAPASAMSGQQTSFDSPEQAADALAAAARQNSTPAMLKILGAQARKLVSSGDPVADKEARAHFVQRYDEMHRIDKVSDDKAELVIGKDEYPTPIPIVRQGDRWRFDSKAGEEEILDRRVGHNELATIATCRAFVEAEREYASKDRSGDGMLKYAQRFRSDPGTHDGLYWPATPDEQESPLGPLVASAQAEGYGKHPAGKPQPYHGYIYKILTRQGKDAPGGAYSYVANGHMIGGFALVAYPALYGNSGVMTFIVNQDGTVYEKDLGPGTARLAGRMADYNPDSSWKTP
jgi:hypothetical protein